MSGPIKHGLNVRRTRTCEAPGCGKEYTTQRLTSRFCSDDCRTNHGAWSYPVSVQTNARAFGVTKS